MQPYRVPAPARPVRHKPNVFLILLTVFGGIALVATLAFSFLKLGIPGLPAPGESDVSDHPEIAPLLATVRDLDACKVEYHQRDKRGTRQHADKLFPGSCSAERGSFPMPTSFATDVPQGWVFRSGFRLSRRSQSDPWKLFIEKDEAALPDVVAAMKLTTAYLRDDYMKDMTYWRSSAERYDAELEKAKEDKKKADDRAKSSW